MFQQILSDKKRNTFKIFVQPEVMDAGKIMNSPYEWIYEGHDFPNTWHFDCIYHIWNIHHLLG